MFYIYIDYIDVCVCCDTHIAGRGFLCVCLCVCVWGGGGGYKLYHKITLSYKKAL